MTNCITLACTLARRLKYSSGTRIQHDLAWLNKLILVSERELNNLTHGYKLQISKTVSLFKWIGSSLLYAITCSFQPKLKQSTFSTLWSCSQRTYINLNNSTFQLASGNRFHAFMHTTCMFQYTISGCGLTLSIFESFIHLHTFISSTHM